MGSMVQFGVVDSRSLFAWKWNRSPEKHEQKEEEEEEEEEEEKEGEEEGEVLENDGKLEMVEDEQEH